MGSSSFRYGRSVPLKGPMAVIFGVFMSLFFLFFILNFVFIFFLPDFFFNIGTWFFLIPPILMFVMVITIMIMSIRRMVKGGGPTQESGFWTGGDKDLSSLASSQGYLVTRLPNLDVSTAQFIFEKNNQKTLIKLLVNKQTFTNGMVQDLAKGLSQYQAREAWIIQSPPTFIENDCSFARFYNVLLLTQEEAIQKLTPIVSPPQGS